MKIRLTQTLLISFFQQLLLVTATSTTSEGSAILLSASSSSSSSSSVSSNLNASLAAVCTPTECIQGVNSLSAGTSIITPISNNISRSTILLPGTYTSTSSIQANTSNILNFNSSSIYTNSIGFSSTGNLGSTFIVSLLPGFISYTAPLYQGIASYLPLSTSSSNTSLSTSTGGTIQSFLISSNVWVILSIGIPATRVVMYKGINDIGNLPSGIIGSTTSGINILDIQSSNCPIPCASGGSCNSNATCVCRPGFTGVTCDACAPGFFGSTCQACPIGCLNCDSGITGTGRCIPTPIVNITASACNCINGVCTTSTSNSICSCNAGWTTAGNLTQCSICASGYYPSSSGDCLACDPTCATCSGPTGTCLTCQLSLQPLSTDSTKCTTANSALLNGTFIACPSRTFYQSSSSSCIACNPLCDTCYNGNSNGCLSCRTPNALLGGQCVGFSSTSGVCDSVVVYFGGKAVGNNAGWVLDNNKGVCDALPAKCTAGSIDNFTSASTRSQLSCSACLAGSYLSGGKCLTSCPAGTLSLDGKTCAPCDSSCSTCSGSTTFCTLCSDTTKLTLNGTCVPGPACPSGYFSSLSNSTSTATTTTCLACHPDCATCSTSFDKCLTCPTTRPILSSNFTCLQTCSNSNQFYDITKSNCSTCSSNCESCSSSGDGNCLSCSSNMVLKQGFCVAAKCSLIVPYFGVCLSDLVVVSATSVISSNHSKTLPWWTILLIIIGSLIIITILGLMFRRKEQKRRRIKTAKFANDLGQKEVEIKLKSLNHINTVVYPIIPNTYRSDEFDLEEDLRGIPLTPPFISTMEEDRNSKISSRWSGTSFGTTTLSKPTLPKPLVPQETGNSIYSQDSVMSGQSLPWGTHNPYNR